MLSTGANIWTLSKVSKTTATISDIIFNGEFQVSQLTLPPKE